MSPNVAPAASDGPSQAFLSLGKTPLADALVPPDAARPARGALPARRRLLPELHARAASSRRCRPSELFDDDYPYFSSFSPYLLRHSREHARRAHRERAASGPTASSSSWRATTATCCATSSRPASRCSASSPRPARPAAAEAAGVPDPRRVLRHRAGRAELRAERRRGRRDRRQQRDGPRAGPQRLRGRASRMLLADDGVITVENPYVRDLIDHCEFDTIYHEHFCYYSCTSVDRAGAVATACTSTTSSTSPICTAARCAGTSGKHERSAATGGQQLPRRTRQRSGPDRARLLRDVRRAGRARQARPARTARRPAGRRQDHRRVRRRGQGQRRWSTTCGIGTDLVDFVVDRNVHKQGRFMPGTHQPILDPAALLERPARLHCSCSPGTSRRDHRAAARVPRPRRPVHRPRPDAAGPREQTALPSGEPN